MLIVGKDILDTKLVELANSAHLKHSTYDLTVGEFVPVGQDRIRSQRQDRPDFYLLQPREMIWIISREEFNLPNDVTGLATLRTTYTKAGLLALGVGIIDPLYRGPISTALLNFSDVPREIRKGDPFFRVLFFEHGDVSAYHRRDESVPHGRYMQELEGASIQGQFPQNFLNTNPESEDARARTFWALGSAFVKRHWFSSAVVGVVLLVNFLFMYRQGLAPVLEQVFAGDWWKAWQAILRFGEIAPPDTPPTPKS